MAGLVDKLRGIDNKISGGVICIVTATLAAVVIVCIVALSFGTVENTEPITNIMIMGSSFLFGSFVMMAKGATTLERVKYVPFRPGDFGSQDI